MYDSFVCSAVIDLNLICKYCLDGPFLEREVLLRNIGETCYAWRCVADLLNVYSPSLSGELWKMGHEKVGNLESFSISVSASLHRYLQVLSLLPSPGRPPWYQNKSKESNGAHLNTRLHISASNNTFDFLSTAGMGDVINVTQEVELAGGLDIWEMGVNFQNKRPT
ncbi:hypothetical protein K439DRAFT_1641819 [Ramaria rubella]|nr:hypothetical protein K439DRAFT_1641819 [Ramaria rubella]